MKYSHTYLKEILKRTGKVALVGVSANPVRPSYFVARYLLLKGFDIVPVNPRHTGETILGKTVYGSLADAGSDIDMVDIFRRSEAVPEIVDEALDVLPALRTIWMQIGVQHAAAAQKAQSQGIDVIQDLCPKMEYQRLFGELRMAGIATGVISSTM